MTPEFYRPVPLERIGSSGLTLTLEAKAAECRALAARLAIPAVGGLACSFALRRIAPGIVEADGRLEARVTRTCVVSLEDFETDVLEEFTVRFVPAGSESDDPDPESLDEIPYEADAIDLGEVAAEQLALALDPFPRAPGAALPEAAASTETATQSGPFAALAARRTQH